MPGGGWVAEEWEVEQMPSFTSSRFGAFQHSAHSHYIRHGLFKQSGV